ncbi:hypothetical protein AAG906_039270 [Vitis piasezkii]
MGTNKERIEHLELRLALHRISSVLITNQENPNHGNPHREGNSGGRQIISSKLAKLEFPRFSGDDPTEWFNWARFGPSGSEDFDEALSRIKQLETWLSRNPLRRPLIWHECKTSNLHDNNALPQTMRVAPTTPVVPIRRLTWDKMQRRRDQARHRCQKSQFLFLEGHVGIVVCEDIIDQPMLEEDQGGDTGEVHEPELEPKIKLHALTRWMGPRTMCITARMGPHEVVVLVDSGSMHNFISDHLANMPKLPIIPMEAFFVRVANGEKLRCQGLYNKLRMNYRRSFAKAMRYLQLLKDYVDVFQEPSSLSPVREVEHCITLKEGTQPINVRQYRYAHFQKDETEK